MLNNIKELYRYRVLIWSLVVRHLSIRYRGSVLGFLWSFLNPLCLMLVYMLVFRYYIRFDHVENYTIFLFCGLLPWIWLTSSLIEGTNAIVSSGHLITKSMFPAHILPTVAILTNMVNFILSLPLLFIFMFFGGVELRWSLLALPLIALGQLLCLQGITLALSALNVHYRDVQHMVGNMLTFLFFLCPILYPISVVPERFRFTMEYNPLALLTTFYQGVIMDGTLPSLTAVLYFSVFTVIALYAGTKIFNYYRESFAELL